MIDQDLRPCNDGLCDLIGKVGVGFLQKLSEAVEIGKSIERPFKRHLLCQGWNEGVPQVRSQCTTSSCGTVF